MSAYNRYGHKDARNRNHNKLNNYGYTYGTEAYDYERVEHQIPVRRKKQVKRRKKRNSSLSIEDIKFGATLSLCGFLVFISSFCYIGNYSRLNFKQMELRKLKLESIEIDSAINKCRATIAENERLEKIKPKAMELGYRDPLPHQIVYIELEEKSYTMYGD